MDSQYDGFYEENQDLIDERRKQLDLERSQQESDQSGEPFWLKCPKCGVHMREISLSGILVEQCGGCGGLFFDSGELETLLAIEERKGFFNSMKRVLDS